MQRRIIQRRIIETQNSSFGSKVTLYCVEFRQNIGVLFSYQGEGKSFTYMMVRSYALGIDIGSYTMFVADDHLEGFITTEGRSDGETSILGFFSPPTPNKIIEFLTTYRITSNK